MTQLLQDKKQLCILSHSEGESVHERLPGTSVASSSKKERLPHKQPPMINVSVCIYIYVYVYMSIYIRVCHIMVLQVVPSGNARRNLTCDKHQISAHHCVIMCSTGLPCCSVFGHGFCRSRFHIRVFCSLWLPVGQVHSKTHSLLRDQPSEIFGQGFGNPLEASAVWIHLGVKARVWPATLEWRQYAIPLQPTHQGPEYVPWAMWLLSGVGT